MGSLDLEKHCWQGLWLEKQMFHFSQHLDLNLWRCWFECELQKLEIYSKRQKLRELLSCLSMR
jgi:hypothetical protein